MPGSLRRQAISTHDIGDVDVSFLFYMIKNFNYLCHAGVEEWYKL